jgi:Na+-driven multidrug efflux pump
MIINIFFSILNYFLNQLLIYNAALGYKGSPIATAITRFAIFFASLILIQFYYKPKLNSNNNDNKEKISNKVNMKEKYKIYLK